MIGKNINGTHECFVCGNYYEWGTIPASTGMAFVVYEKPKNVATEYAVEKTDDGKTKFEVICTCPRCGTKNKFIVEREV